MSDNTIADNIAQQLGGKRFLLMIGQPCFWTQPNGLRFRLPRNVSGANLCQIELLPLDLYLVTFAKVAKRSLSIEVISVHEDVHAEDLRSIFEETTGLRTSLGTLGR